jgi:putative Mn2+ efflux pump MntP
MSLIELFLIAAGLSMDAFAVAISAGVSMKQASIRKALTLGLYFGMFQAVMPLIGYFLGAQFSDKITTFDHWIAFILLAFIGVKMVWEGLCGGLRQVEGEMSLRVSKMLPLAIATSIDALAVGVSFAFLNVSIVSAVTFIGIVTLLISMVGVKIGNIFGTKFKSKAEIAGGAILVLIGIKILLEHLIFQ